MLAHELGHLVMHRFPTATMEDEANEFASTFLMPAGDAASAFKGRRVTLELLAALKPEWKMSMQALLLRAKALGYIDHNQSRYIWQQMGSKGWRLSEPAELDFEHEKPTVLRSIIKAHLGDLGYSLSDLCGLIPLHEHEFLKMYGPINGNGPPRPRLRAVA